jgi:nitroreductase/NAD-dependent dihydropyrimidine dehydrogenase PreA subunit
MNHFTIDLEKCKQDGICAAECPGGIIRWQGPGYYPTAAKEAAKFCIQCGHCVAVCPHGAISLDNLTPGNCPPVDRTLIPGPEQVEHLLRSRRSIRTFKRQTIEQEQILKLINIARYAPTGHNLQQVHWLVVKEPEEVAKLAGLVVDWMRYMIENKPDLAAALAMPQVVAAWEQGKDAVCRHAPHLVIAHAPKKIASSPTDCVIALTYLELAAYSMGLGTCWAGYFTTAANVYPPLAKALNLPEDHRVPGTMMLGHPKYQYHRLPERNEPKLTWR